MNLLFVFDTEILPHRGGVERVTCLLASELEKRGYGVSFLTLDSFGPCGSTEFGSRLKKLLEERKIDKVIFQSTSDSIVRTLEMLPGDVGRYLVVHMAPHPVNGFERKVMSLTPWRGLGVKRKVLKLLGMISPALIRKVNVRRNSSRYLRISSCVDRLVLLSGRYVGRMLALTPGMAAEKVAAVNNPNTFDVPDGETFTKGKTLLFVGRLSNPQKNVVGFIDVWKRFHALHPDWQAKIVGEGEHRDIIEKYAEKAGVRNLQFEGSRRNIADYYREAPILCMTSTYEGWPMVLPEAMAYGCVPVAFDTYEAVHDLIEDDVEGLLIKPFDTGGMVNALHLLAADERKRKEMARAAREKIRAFTVTNIVDQWEELFRMLN